jgi:hypothetical protein
MLVKEKVILRGIAQLLSDQANPSFTGLNELVEPFGFEVVKTKSKIKNQILVLANNDEDDDDVITLPDHIIDDASIIKFLESKNLGGRKYMLFRSAHKETW